MSRSFPLSRWLLATLLLAGACRAADEPRQLVTDVTRTTEAPADERARSTSSTTSPTSRPTTAAPSNQPPATEPPATEPPATQPPQAQPPPTQPPAAGGTLVTRVVDGDTFEVSIGGGEDRVRIIGINSPEDGECLAEAASEWLRFRIDGKRVALVADRTDRDQYGRLLRYVELGGSDVGVEIVRAGYAIARRYPPDTARASALEAAQRDAKAAKAGMWAEDACGPAQSGGDLVISEIRFDADGNDNDNKNDEWVRIRNDGGSRADLTGWVLKDESASHRYDFPGGFTLEPGASVTVRTGCGADTASDLYWCKSGSAVWNNSGDTAFLLDPNGNVVDSRSG